MSAIIREERIGDCRLIQGDCLAVMPELGRFDAVVTSPPYDGMRDYGEGFNGVDCLAVISCVSEILLTGGVCVWNVADATVNGSETGSSFRQALHAMDCGMLLHDTMIWNKCSFSAVGSLASRYAPVFEYMFIFSNGPPKTFNPIKDRINKHAGTRWYGTIREASGKLSKTTGAGEKNVARYGQRFNVWEVSPCVSNAERTGHPAQMAYDIAEGHTRSWSNLGELILDPFMGSGTTGVACVKLGRKFTGIELDPEYFDIACKRIEEAYRQPDMLIEAENVPAPVQEGFEL